MILGAWFWRLYGPRMVQPFRPERVSPASYDVGLGRSVIFYRFHGYDFPGLEAEVYEDGILIRGTNWIVGPEVKAGDIFLAATEEYFKQPRGISLSYMSKSSVARGFLEHLHAGWGEHGFHGAYTLEFQAKVDGKLVPGLPVGQMIAHATLGWHSYMDKQDRHYQFQRGVAENKNVGGLAWRPWWEDGELRLRWADRMNVDPRMENRFASIAAMRELIRGGKIGVKEGW